MLNHSAQERGLWLSCKVSGHHTDEDTHPGRDQIQSKGRCVEKSAQGLGHMGSTRGSCANSITLSKCLWPQLPPCKRKRSLGRIKYTGPLPRCIAPKTNSETLWFCFCIKRPRIIHLLQPSVAVCSVDHKTYPAGCHS